MTNDPKALAAKFMAALSPIERKRTEKRLAEGYRVKRISEEAGMIVIEWSKSPG